MSAIADCFLDTNLIVYAYSAGLTEHAKREMSRKLMLDNAFAISIQVLQEFFVNITRTPRAASRPHLTPVEARVVIESLLQRPVAANTAETLRDALHIQSRYGFSFWDSHIIASTKSLGIKTLYSEDMQHGQTIEGITIINPFLAA